jgi:hypothetical protein
VPTTVYQPKAELMNNLPTKALLLLALMATSTPALSCNSKTGLPTQSAEFMTQGKIIKSLEFNDSSIKTITMPNGFLLGVVIEPATDEHHAELAESWNHVPEMVKITLYDMTSKTPRQLTQTWGGASSLQGYGEKGGADRVVELGNPGLLIILQKSVCAKIPSP